MVTCVAQQMSSMSNINYPHKLIRAATHDSLFPVMTRRKRLLSEQNDCQHSTMKLSNDYIHVDKKVKTGNYTYNE